VHVCCECVCVSVIIYHRWWIVLCGVANSRVLVVRLG